MEHSPSLGQRSRLGLRTASRAFRPSPLEIIFLFLILAIAAYGGFTLYAESTGLNDPPPPEPTYAIASQTTLTTSVSASGSVEATQQISLNFDIGDGSGTGTGATVAEVLVSAGDTVAEGQVLARVDDTTLRQELDFAEADLLSAEARYNSEFEGPSVSEIASAEQTVTNATSQLLTARNALDDLLASPSASDIAAAQQAVNNAENTLQSALDAKTRAQDAVVTDQNNVNAARQTLSDAEKGLDDAIAALNDAYSSQDSAENEVASAYSSLSYAHSNLESALESCDPIAGSSPQSAPSLPSRGSSATTANSVSFDFACENTNVTEQAVSQWISSYNSSVAPYNSALNTSTQDQAITAAEAAVETAEAAVSRAETDLTTAQQTLNTDLAALNNGNLDRSIESAQLGVATARREQADTLAGPTQADIDTANLGMQSAQSSLTSAQARYSELFETPGLDVTEPLRVAVEQARVNLTKAEANVEGATMTAPFAGVITSVNITVGTDVAPADEAMVLLNPNLIRIDTNVDQADVSELAVGQSAEVTFDALPDQTYQATVTGVGLTPTVTSGVVTYMITLSMDTSRLPAGTPVPSPGMTASVSITTSSVENALVIPSQAVTTSGLTQMVTVHTEDADEERQVTTGISSGTQIQILSGLEAGEQVVVPTSIGGTAAEDAGGQGQQQFPAPGGGAFPGEGGGGFPGPGP